MKYILDKIDNLEPETTNIESNIPDIERKALNELKQNKDIIIKKLDKTNIMVVMDTDFYKNKLVLGDHLKNESTYETTSEKVDRNSFTNVKRLMDKHRLCLTKDEYEFITDYEWKSSNFYVNPKIAKCKEISDRIAELKCNYIHIEAPMTLKGRPIIAGPESPNETFKYFNWKNPITYLIETNYIYKRRLGIS